MARRLTTGVAGRNVLGSLVAVENNLRSVVDNADVVLQANGTGIARSTTHLQIDNANSLRLADSSGNPNAYVALQAPSTAGGFTLTLPTSTGTAGYVLSTDGSGNLSWDSVAVSVTDQISDSSTYYPTLTTSTSGNVTEVSTSSTKLSYQPSTGTLTVNNLTASNTLQASTITETSSMVLKTDIEPIVDAGKIIAALTGVNYTRISSGCKEVGLIAEDVEKILPELVSGAGKYKAIPYSRLSVYLIEAFKSLQAEVDNLKKSK